MADEEDVSVKIWHRCVTECCVKLGKNGNETLEMLRQACGGETLSRAAVFQWWRHFKDGNTRVIDKARSGRPSTAVTAVNIAKTAELLENDRRLTLRELSASLSTSFERTLHIVTEILQMRPVCARWVPRNLTEEQMQRRVQVCKNTVQMWETIPNFLTSIVTCDELWIHHYVLVIKTTAKGAETLKFATTQKVPFISLGG